MRGKISRRELLLSSGVVLGSGTLAVALGSQNTTATVSTESLSVPDKEKLIADQSVDDVRLEVTAGWSFDANVTITGANLRLKVGDTEDSAETIARTSVDNLGTESTSGEETLSGSVLSAPDFDASQFNREFGSSSTEITVVVELDILRNGEVEQTAQAVDTATITISAEEVSVSASVGGEGSVTVETS